MPLIYLNCPKYAFDQFNKNKLADELTTIALQIEQLPNTPFVRSTCWIFFNEIKANNIYKGGEVISSEDKILSMEVNVFKGGLDTIKKGRLIEEFTTCIRKCLNIPDGKVTTLYVIIRDIKEEDWGVFGSRITLHDLINPPEEAKPI